MPKKQSKKSFFRTFLSKNNYLYLWPVIFLLFSPNAFSETPLEKLAIEPAAAETSAASEIIEGNEIVSPPFDRDDLPYPVEQSDFVAYQRRLSNLWQLLPLLSESIARGEIDPALRDEMLWEISGDGLPLIVPLFEPQNNGTVPESAVIIIAKDGTIELRADSFPHQLKFTPSFAYLSRLLEFNLFLLEYLTDFDQMGRSNALNLIWFGSKEGEIIVQPLNAEEKRQQFWQKVWELRLLVYRDRRQTSLQQIVNLSLNQIISSKIIPEELKRKIYQLLNAPLNRNKTIGSFIFNPPTALYSTTRESGRPLVSKLKKLLADFPLYSFRIVSDQDDLKGAALQLELDSEAPFLPADSLARFQEALPGDKRQAAAEYRRLLAALKPENITFPISGFRIDGKGVLEFVELKREADGSEGFQLTTLPLVDGTKTGNKILLKIANRTTKSEALNIIGGHLSEADRERLVAIAKAPSLTLDDLHFYRQMVGVITQFDDPKLTALKKLRALSRIRAEKKLIR